MTRFPWRPYNDFALLVDGETFFPAMLLAIRQARRFLLLELYLFESGRLAHRMIEALVAAAARGVQVYLLLDDFGALKLREGDRAALLRAGVRLTFFNPLRLKKSLRNLARDHRKLLLVDGEVAFVGGFGFTDEFDAGNQRPWREVTVRVRGPVLRDWVQLFSQVWQRSCEQLLVLPPPVHEGWEPPASGVMWGRVTCGNGVYHQQIKGALLTQIRRARRRVWIATAYFAPSWKIRRQLRKAARQGLDVRLLLPGKYTDHPAVRYAGHRFYSKLLRAGVRIFEYQPRFIHAKISICDDWVSIGSCNLDHWNLHWNLEANQEVLDSDFALQVVELLRQDMRDSIEYDYARWRRRPWYRRALEYALGSLDGWLMRLK